MTADGEQSQPTGATLGQKFTQTDAEGAGSEAMEFAGESHSLPGDIKDEEHDTQEEQNDNEADIPQ